MTTYALLVGIDAYRAPVPRLDGCRNDIEALADYLTARSGTKPVLRTLVDAAATRKAVIGAFRTHLGRAGTGDVALFAYCGHGSEEPVPPAIADLEPTGRIQTLILFDSDRKVGGRLRRPLADKELSLLIAEVAARGAHVVVILDCCHSGGGTRDPFVRTRGWRPDPDLVEPRHRELVREIASARPSSEFLPGALESWVAPRPAHVALAACRSFETAKELRVGDEARGAFSVALVESLGALGTRTTYRSLLDTIRARVDRAVEQQRPELYPLEPGGLGDALFLDGTVEPVPATFTVTHGFDGWEVDAGLVHGLRPPEGDEAFVLACEAPDGRPAGAVRVTAVQVGRSTVEPIGWTMQEVAYRAVVADVPLRPPRSSSIRGPGRPGAPVTGRRPPTVDLVHDAIVQAIATSGPDGAPSPYVRIVDAGARGRRRAVRLRVAVPGPGIAQITRADGSPIAGPVTGVGGGEGPARLVAARLEHVARWEQVRLLGDHPSPLADAVVLEVYAADDAPDHASARPSAAAVRRRVPAGVPPRSRCGGPMGGPARLPRPPQPVRRRPVGRGARPDRPVPLSRRAGDDAGRGRSRLVAGGSAADPGRPSPRDVPPVPGASARDWLKVVVSDVAFQATSFDLGALDEPVARGVGGRRSPRNTLERIAGRAVTRDIGGGGEPPAVRWAATTVTLEVRVPD